MSWEKAVGHGNKKKRKKVARYLQQGFCDGPDGCGASTIGGRCELCNPKRRDDDESFEAIYGER